jgi:hypothetical protein
MMLTSAFRIPAHLMGEVCAYPLTPALMAAFDRLSAKWRGQAGSEHASAPYASLATALTAVTGQPVMILPRPRERNDPHWLITTTPIDPGLLEMATRIWERLAGGTGAMGESLAAIQPAIMSVTGDIDHSVRGRVSAAGWIYRVLNWNVAAALAATPIDFDGRKVPFRLDTDGSLVAWDDPIVRTGRDGGAARGLVKISLAIKLLPGVGDLVAIPTISLTRLVGDLYKVKSVWIDHGRNNGGSALLRLPIIRRKDDEAWRSVFRDFSGQIVEECGLSPLPWSQEALTEHPDRVRGWRGENHSHRLGTGVGPRTYRRFLEHVTAVTGAEPITYARTPIKVLNNADKTLVEALDDAVTAAGYARLRLVHLSSGSATRQRVRQALAGYQPGVEVGRAHPLTARSEIVAYDVPESLEHGKIDRSPLLSAAPLLQAEPGTLILALVDTEYDPAGQVTDDAKPALRALLARLGIPSQFLAVSPGSDGSIEPGKDDYPVATALRDLMRAGGLTDDRLARAVRLSPHPLAQDTWLVGVHVRKQNTRKNGNGYRGRPLLVVTLTAVRARPAGAWEILTHVRGRGWVRQAEGLAAFHAQAIGEPVDNDQDAFARLRGYVDGALGELPGGLPVVVMCDADETRRVWAGLSDTRLRQGVLPGDSLASAARIAVVRVGTSDQAVPRPIHCTDGRQAEDPRKPAKPRNRLYELRGDDGTRSWLLGHSSRLFNEGGKGRVGGDFTRFTLPAERAREQANNWHAFTATEFVVAKPGPFTEESSAALTARLCAQPLSWDAQTRRPLPLHLAVIADADHPGYRSDRSDEGEP